MMQDFERLGTFYLGKIFNPQSQSVTDELVLYDSKDLTTHAVCVGMTGSGKTGLGIDLIEEAGLDQIPAILVDPKGDLGNLLLTFPDLSPSDFLSWVDPAEAERKRMTLEDYAASVAKTWKAGLKEWGEDGRRIQRLKDAIQMMIYTPASTAGVPISILSSFTAPSKEILADPTAFRERVLSTTSSLLGLLGISADPIKSREHILISTLMDRSWRQGISIDLPTIIEQVQNPPFDQIGALDINTFFPAKERMELAINLNNLLASPGFQAWMQGEPLDIHKLLYTSEGKPKLSILSIAHLSDPERMFFVTLLLNQLLSWMRGQPGTSSLRALFYMDEIFGYFPPVAMPPSKTPLITLLKQARAYGLGIALATQNPVDLDYKGLSNCGTWFIGKLQTDRDKARVLEGLNVASNGHMNTKLLDHMLANTGNRVFILRSVHQKDPILFQTRWTMSYLRGPMTLSQIKILTEEKVPKAPEELPSKKQSKPTAPPGIQEFFMTSAQPVLYQPLVVGFAKLHFVDAKYNIDTWQDLTLIAPSTPDGQAIQWEDGESGPDIKNRLVEAPLPDCSFAELPAGLKQAKNYSSFQKSLTEWIYQNQTLTFFRYSALALTSKAGEDETAFRTRISIALREKRDEQVKKIHDKFTPKIAALTEKVRRAEEKLSQQHNQAKQQKAETYISIGSTILGALLGKGVTKETITQAGSSVRRAGRISKENQDVIHAEENLKSLKKQLEDLQAQLKSEIEQISIPSDVKDIKIESAQLRPRKSDISVEPIALVWWR